MTLAELVVLALKVSIAMMVFSVGLGTAPRELTTLLRSPAKLVGALVAMNLVMLARRSATGRCRQWPSSSWRGWSSAI
jgi:phage terminase large subunit-like protein